MASAFRPSVGLTPWRYRVSPRALPERVMEPIPFPFSCPLPEQQLGQVEPRWQPLSQLGPVWAEVVAEVVAAERAA
jgi:hypothetical protein